MQSESPLCKEIDLKMARPCLSKIWTCVGAFGLILFAPITEAKRSCETCAVYQYAQDGDFHDGEFHGRDSHNRDSHNRDNGRVEGEPAVTLYVVDDATLENLSQMSDAQLKQWIDSLDDSDQVQVAGPHRRRKKRSAKKPKACVVGKVYKGEASFYGPGVGKQTANGELFNRYGLTAAHKKLPFGAIAEVVNLRRGRHFGKRVKVRFNDRGPFNHRIVDLAEGAGEKVGLTQGAGVAKVRMTILSCPN